MQAAIAATFSRHIPIRRGIREGLFLFSLSSFRQSQTISIKAAPFYIKAAPFYIKGVRFYNNPFASPPAAKVPEHTPLPRKRERNASFFGAEIMKKRTEPTHLLSAPRCRKKEAGLAFASEMDYSILSRL
ncbi:MAG: hypothetical protein J5698_00795 [Bacteroidaceae bacterium]|nr:hypothetical protein [Bacteroidaceae bacterium]